MPRKRLVDQLSSPTNHRKKKKSASSKKSLPSSSGGVVAALSETSFLSKLNALRKFVNEAGISTNEKDLSACLRRCALNVERALEQLFTSQFACNEDRSSSSATPRKSTIDTSISHPPCNGEVINPATTPQTKDNTVDLVNDSESENDKVQHSYEPTFKHAAERPQNNHVEGKDNFRDHYLLLCQRWMNGLSTVRKNGTVYYKEKFNLSWSQDSHSNIIRFQGRSIEGTLPQPISVLLTPFLRYRKDRPILSISAEALMEDRCIPLGGDIPLALSVYIKDPHIFFGLFTDVSSRHMSFASSFGKSSSRKRTPITTAAFKLLQWAEYGNDPVFEAPFSKDEVEEEETIPLDEDQFVTEATVEGHSEQNSDVVAPWACGLLNNETNNFNLLLEETEPHGLKVSLRPYQRQALHWMMKRENSDNTDDEDFHNQMKFLADLSGTKSSMKASAVFDSSSNEHLQCSCSPVLVSKKLAKESVTIHGEINPGCHHPLWERRFLANRQKNEAISFYVNELLSVASSKPPNPPKQCRGGILADAMGLGKTVMLISLILTDKNRTKPDVRPTGSLVVLSEEDDMELVHQHREPALPVQNQQFDYEDDEDDEYKLDRSNKNFLSFPVHNKTYSTKTTLVVAPLSLILQWEEEIKSKTSLSCYVHYGSSGNKQTTSDFDGVDVVVTSYGTLQGEFLSKVKKQTQNGSTVLLSHDWDRIILDEAHCIKNPLTAVSKACSSLKASKRWCVTGTPIQNSLQDLYGLLKFLHHEPWCEASFWKATILNTMNESNDSDTKSAGSPNGGCSEKESNEATTGLSSALSQVKQVISPILLRRTKDSLDGDGKPILSLPPVETQTVTVTLTHAEREFYNALLDKSQCVFEGYVKAGVAEKSWFAIFSLLQRLRQACDHVALTVKNRIIYEDKTKENKNSEMYITSDENVLDSNASTTQGETAVNDKFLHELLKKFDKDNIDHKSKTGDCTEQDGINSFSTRVAQSLTRSIQSNIKVTEECPICLDPPPVDGCMLTPCAHMFCKGCLTSYMSQGTKGNSSIVSKQNVMNCPTCNASFDINRIIIVSKNSQGETATRFYSQESVDSKGETSFSETVGNGKNIAARETLEAALAGAPSAKLASVLGELENIWKMSPTAKVLIFSQFLGFLDLTETQLTLKGIEFNRLDGKMSKKERAMALSRFSASTGKSVFLASMKAGGVGINLVAASCVFIVDPWWNAAIEDQCINRIHRIGQMAKVVQVRKFVVEDSVEEKIVSLQRRKKDIANEILSDSADRSGAFNGSKPTLDDFKLLFQR